MGGSVAGVMVRVGASGAGGSRVTLTGAGCGWRVTENPEGKVKGVERMWTVSWWETLPYGGEAHRLWMVELRLGHPEIVVCGELSALGWWVVISLAELHGNGGQR